ncbi:polysaccharide lyase-domain-containing protein [Rhexocercosporidium sp. MPI-PUGE-AT-0058]|nr:polysaccharide lyase-domain-containing protein [Rhexocercosporidium sp. MPI-PUGE-AT-0058]
MLLKTICLAGLATFSTVQGVQTFSNKGTFPGNWDDSYIDGKTQGTIDQVSNVWYESPTSIKMTQTYIPSGYTGRYHSEVHKFNAYKKGDTGFYGFMFRLSQDWQFVPAQGYNLAQFIADFTDLPCEEDWMPSSMIWIHGNKLQSRVRMGNVCPTSQQETLPFENLATVTAGEWHKVLIQASWQSDETGYYKIWYDDAIVVNRTKIRTTVTDGRPFQFRVGLYANSWTSPGKMLGTQGFRQVWFDEIATGTTYKDVDPDQW